MLGASSSTTSVLTVSARGSDATEWLSQILAGGSMDRARHQQIEGREPRRMSSGGMGIVHDASRLRRTSGASLVASRWAE